MFAVNENSKLSVLSLSWGETMKRRMTPIFQDSFQKRYWRRIVLLSLLAIAVITGIWWWLQNRTDRPNEQQYPVLGAQISQEDGYQDYQILKKESLKFVYLKATEGASYKDDNFDSNYSRAEGSGMSVGVYHFFSFDSSPEDQAQQFINSVGQDTGHLPIMVYLSYYNDYAQKPPAKAKTQRAIARFVTLVNQYYHQDCIIGGAPALLKRYVPTKGTYPLWQTTQQRPTVGTKNGFWQYTTASKIPGGRDDSEYQLAVFTGTPQEWQKLK